MLAGLVLAFTALPAAPAVGADPAAPERPLERIDRMRVVGRPVLDQTSKQGLYIWLEDGSFHVAAVTNLPIGTKKKLTRTFTVTLSSTGPIEASARSLGGLTRVGGDDSTLVLRAVVGPEPELGSFRTTGDVTVFGAAIAQEREAPLFVGPLARPAASGVRIGRF